MATFTLQSPGKATSSHDVALETAPVADIEHDAKSIPDSSDFAHWSLTGGRYFLYLPHNEDDGVFTKPSPLTYFQE